MPTPRKTTTSTAPTGSSNESETAGLAEAALADKDQEVQEFEAEFAFTAADLDYQSFTADAAAALGRPTFPELKDEYSNLWAEMAIRRDKLPEVDAIVQRIVGHKDSYRAVEQLTRVPWFAIAIIHNLEAGGDFSRHLHNGDPLTARTVHVPAGRPSSGNPPFTWEESAADALQYDGLTQVTDWSTEHLAYQFENFNGWGYRLYHPHVKSPYLWSYSNHYTQGKYVGDGQWSETAVSRQCGAMVLLKRLQETGEIRLDRAALDEPVPTPQPASTPFTLVALTQASAPMTWDELTQASIAMTGDALTQASTPTTGDAMDRARVGEKVLPYDRSIVPQETGFWCGPAATQVVLNSRGIFIAERDLALSIGTHAGGTDYVGLIERDLDKRVPQAGYMSVYMPNDPPTPAQRERLWNDLVRGIDAGWGMIMNWVAPPSNYPRGVKGSDSPAYRGGTVYHYVAAMGYDDTPGARAVWIADSGFRPFGYWCGFDQVATLIPPKGYTYADAAP
jgi:lysozyme family protein